jgi:uncharacterized protein YgiM (DUF1202 family)
MKTNYWWLVAATLSTGLMAQTNSPAPTTAPALAAAPATTNVPAKQKPAVRAPKPVTLVNLAPGPTLVTASNVNVRGQAGFNGEVITTLIQGDIVTVLGLITIERPKADEPAQWARIAFPAKAHVFVNAMFIDAANKTVKPAKLNLRAGAGENFSVVGLLKRGDSVHEIVTKGDWMEIEAPPGAFAFIAAEYLKSEAPAVAAAEPAPVTTPPLVVTPVVTAPAETNAPAQPAIAVEATNVVAATNEPIAIVATNEPVAKPPEAEAPPAPPRIVQREGIVRSTWSVQAPTPFALVNTETGETLNYLYTASPELNLKRYRGLRVFVTGEEGLDQRWRNTPVLTIQKIQLLE